MVLLCISLLAGCQSKPNPAHGEVQALYAQVKTDYDALVKSLTEAGAATIDGVKETIEETGNELSSIGEKIENSQIAKLTEQELANLKTTLSGMGETFSGLTASAEKALSTLGQQIEDAAGSTLAGAEEAVETLLAEAAAKYISITESLENLSEEASAALESEYEKLAQEFDAFTEEIANSDAAAWTEETVEKLGKGLSGLLESLQAFGEKVEAAIQ